MKKLLIIAAALALPGCAAALPVALDTLVSIAKPADAVGDKVVLEGTRGLILAHNAYQGAAMAATAAVKTGRLSSQQLDAIEAANTKALALLNDGNTALSTAERVAGVLNAANEINVALGR
jgi:hypothetical protein